jgi:cellulose synthase (UDP-forming)
LSPIAIPYFVMFFVLLAAAIYSGWRLATEPVASDLLMIVAIWNLINLGVAGAGLGVVAERRELRRNQRLPIRRHGILRQGQRTWTVILVDASSGGVSVQFPDHEPDIDPDSDWRGEIEVRRGGRAVSFPVAIRSVREFDGTNVFGFAYPERLPETFMAIAEMMYSDQAVLQERISRRQVRLDIVRGTLRFARWSIVESFRATGYLFGFGRSGKIVSQADAPIVVKTNNAQIPGKNAGCYGPDRRSADPMRNLISCPRRLAAAFQQPGASRPTRKACCRHTPPAASPVPVSLRGTSARAPSCRPGRCRWPSAAAIERADAGQRSSSRLRIDA